MAGAAAGDQPAARRLAALDAALPDGRRFSPLLEEVADAFGDCRVERIALSPQEGLSLQGRAGSYSGGGGLRGAAAGAPGTCPVVPAVCGVDPLRRPDPVASTWPGRCGRRRRRGSRDEPHAAASGASGRCERRAGPVPGGASSCSSGLRGRGGSRPGGPGPGRRRPRAAGDRRLALAAERGTGRRARRSGPRSRARRRTAAIWRRFGPWPNCRLGGAPGLLPPGAPRPAAAPQTSRRPRLLRPLRLEAERAAPLLARFLRALEDEVPGLYLNAVSLHISDSAAGRWNLSVTGWLLLRGPCDGLW